MDYSISLSEVIVAILFIITSMLGYVIKRQHEKLKQIQEQLSDKKYNLYHSIYSILFDLIKKTKTKENPNVKIQEKIDLKYQEELIAKIIDIKKDLLIYSPDNVVKKFIEWNQSISNGNVGWESKSILLDVYVDIRKDMGYKKTKITKDDILKIILTNSDEVMVFKQI